MRTSALRGKDCEQLATPHVVLSSGAFLLSKENVGMRTLLTRFSSARKNDYVFISSHSVLQGGGHIKN